VSRPRLGYHASLDGLRGIAVALVVLFHFRVPGFAGGFVGVDLFFVLSGFLITRLLLDEWNHTGTVRLRAFYARRALRLLPALLLLLAVCAPFVSRAWLGASVSYIGNWFLALHVLHVSPISHTWSLAIEEQFYLAWPLLLLLLLRARVSRDGIARVAIALALLSCLRKILLCIDHDPGTWMRIYFATDTRADALLIGCAAAALLERERHLSAAFARASLVLAAFGVAYFVATARINDLNLFRHAGLTALAACTAIAIAELVARPWGPVDRVLSWRWLVGLGRISYGVYLWHHPIMFVDLPIANQALLVVVRVALTLLAALGSYYLVERRVLALKTRFAASS
jgi:peptidoglycan/LPS O-acetylase OafA/YrhL